VEKLVNCKNNSKKINMCSIKSIKAYKSDNLSCDNNFRRHPMIWVFWSQCKSTFLREKELNHVGLCENTMKLLECFRDAGRAANNFRNNKELQRHGNVTFQIIIREIVLSLRTAHIAMQMYDNNGNKAIF